MSSLKSTQELKQRIITALLFGIPVLFLVFFNDYTRLAFLLGLILLTTLEFNQLFYKSKQQRIYILVAVVANLLLSLLVLNNILPQAWIIAASVICSLFFVIDLLYVDLNNFEKLAWLKSIAYLGLPFSALISYYGENLFSYLVISVLLLIWISDSAAYFVGKSIGKNKLMPSISPGKTIEGFLGAGMIVLISSYIVSSFAIDLAYSTWIMIGLAVWLWGSVGDLVESKMKRKLNIKDSGNILPGHGGFLDRFDAFYFCLPIVCLIVYLNQF